MLPPGRIAVVCLLLAPSLAWATTLLALDVDGLAATSDAVVRATVTRVTPRWTRDGARIVTDVELAVSESWKGGAPRTIVVMQPGGVVGDLGQRVEGSASFTPGEEVVLFLEARGERYTVSGMAQGRFRVERSSDGTLAYARQDQCQQLRLVDPLTRQEVAPAPLALKLEALRARVQAGSPRATPSLRIAP
jgi:hypothetical protein